MRNSIKISLLIVSAFIFFPGCKKEKDFPHVPAIEYKDFITYANDSAVLSFSFIDGDGDIGLNQNDTLGAFAPTSKFYNNLFMKYYYKNSSGNFVAFDTSFFNPPFDTAFFAYRIPDITPTGQSKLLDGEIRVKILAPYAFLDSNNVMHQVIRFDAFIYDRALNRSNIITTREITVY